LHVLEGKSNCALLCSLTNYLITAKRYAHHNQYLHSPSYQQAKAGKPNNELINKSRVLYVPANPMPPLFSVLFFFAFAFRAHIVQVRYHRTTFSNKKRQVNEKKDNNKDTMTFNKPTSRPLTPATDVAVQSTMGREPSRTLHQRSQINGAAHSTSNWANIVNDNLDLEEDRIRYQEKKRFLQAELQRERLQNQLLREENSHLANDILASNEDFNDLNDHQERDQDQKRQMRQTIDQLMNECDTLRIRLQTQVDVPEQLQQAYCAQKAFQKKLNNAALDRRILEDKLASLESENTNLENLVKELQRSKLQEKGKESDSDHSRTHNNKPAASASRSNLRRVASVPAGNSYPVLDEPEAQSAVQRLRRVSYGSIISEHVSEGKLALLRAQESCFFSTRNAGTTTTPSREVASTLLVDFESNAE
jgi:hypothetical protein